MIRRILIILITIAIFLACLLISSKGKAVRNGMLILSEIPGNFISCELLSGPSGRYFPGARISVVQPGKPDSHIILSEDFYSACYPVISPDGTSMLFSAQQKHGDTWQIWEMELDDLKFTKITSFDENCTDPAYLPDGRLIFSKLTVNDTVRSAHCLYSCNHDGSGLKQLTFSPHDNFATTVLKDGRLLTVNRQLFPVQEDPMLVVLRPDGTKADMFYKNTAGKTLIGGVRETIDGKIVFIESDKESRKEGRLISINYNRPLHTRVDLTSLIMEDFCSVFPLETDKYLVSYRKSDSELFALYEFSPGDKLLGQMVFSDPEYSIVDAVMVAEYEKPKKLPSEMDPAVKTGLLLCQDINFLNQEFTDRFPIAGKATKIEVLGIDTTYGIVQVEEDGSFQLKVIADTPFQIRTLDKEGNVVNGPCSWLWLRPNERRGCIGCHEDPELAPDNKVSLAIKKSPVIVPVHITGIKEKIVDLE